MACPFAVQWLNHHQIRGTACLLCQAFAFLLREFLRSPMGPSQRLNRRVSASTETQRLALHRTRDIVRRACGQGIAGGPGLEQPQCFQDTRRVDLHRALEAIDLAPPPAFHRADVKPADPDEYVDRAHMILGDKRRLRSPDNTIGKCGSVLPAHRSMNPPVLAAHPLTDYTQRAQAREIIVVRQTSEFQRLHRLRASTAPLRCMVLVLIPSELLAKWCAFRVKSRNYDVIEIAI